MKKIDYRDVNPNESFFHFAPKSAFDSVREKGLVPNVGGASKMKSEEEKRVYLSKGKKGILAIKNSFIYEFSQLRICDIPEEYKKYFNYEDYENEDPIPRDDVYKAMAYKMKDELYFLVDAKEGEDYLIDDVHVTISGVAHDVKGIPNHTISPNKLSIITTPEGYTAYDVVKSIYMDLQARNPKFVDVIKTMNSSLDEMFDYMEHGIFKETSVRSLGEQIIEKYKEPESLEIEDENNRIMNMIEENKNLKRYEESEER